MRIRHYFSTAIGGVVASSSSYDLVSMEAESKEELIVGPPPCDEYRSMTLPSYFSKKGKLQQQVR
jgi:hypothetical protein